MYGWGDWNNKNYARDRIFRASSGVAVTAQLLGQAYDLLHQLAVGGGLVALLQVDVIFEAHTDIAAHDDARGHHGPRAPADAGDGPGGTGGDLLD